VSAPVRSAAGHGQAAARRLPTAEIDELFERWTVRRERAARDRIVEEYMPLARSLAYRYAHSSEPFEDLVQVASLALVKAVDRFDPARGRRFGAFAVPTILGELRRHFRDSGWALHVPRADKELAQAVSEAERAIVSETGRAPTAQRLAEFMNVDLERVLEGLGAARAYATVPLEAPSEPEDGGGASLGEVIGRTDPGYRRVERRMALAAGLQEISERDAELLRMRFGEELSQAEIGARIGVSQMQVSRLLQRCFETIRESIDEASEQRLAA
jgi:RNA polymerase sigma-B factor